MSAKKTTKATKSPAPATKLTSPAITKAAASAGAVKPKAAKAPAKAAPAKKPAAKAPVRVAATAPEPTPTPVVPVPAPAPAAAIKEVARKAVTTTITAKIDVGFGNTITIRGEGPGLSWDTGLLMTNLGSDLWEVQLGESARPFIFKFLVNDLSWSTGPDYVLESGVSVLLKPTF